MDKPRSADIDEQRDALLVLHARAGAFGGLDARAVPGLRHPSVAEALRAVADADDGAVSAAARLRVLHDLAKADFPGYDEAEGEYRALAASVADARGLDAEQVLSDVKESAREQVAFDRTTTGRALHHRDVAFVDQDVCTTRTVRTDGLLATWVFSEFETDAPFAGVADWIDPRSWPERSPMMFKRMDLVGAQGPVEIAALGDHHWHGVFHEEVQLVKRVNTLLHCDYWRGDSAAGMTYSLDLSLDGEIDVDRGFLSVEDLGDVRRVRALKLVGFTTDAWDDVARMVCPFWTDWVRGAVEGGTTSRPTPPQPGPPSGKPSTPTADTLDAWIRFFGESARTYLDIFADMGNTVRAPGFAPADLMADGNRYWSQLAKDWAKAWSYGLEALEEVGREGTDAGLTPPDTERWTGRGLASAMTAAATGAAATSAAPAGESTTVPVPGLTADTKVECSPLMSIESGGAALSDVSVTVEPLGDGRFGARVQTTDVSVPPGLYVGTLRIPGQEAATPVQLYVARAREARRA